jgi:hypothetical protein
VEYSVSPTADKVISVGPQRCSMERSVSAVEIFQNDALSYVQVSFRVLRLTPDPQHSRDQLRRLPRQQLEYSNGPGD